MPCIHVADVPDYAIKVGKLPAGNQNTIVCMGQFERSVLIGRRALSVASPTDNLS